MMPKQAPTVTSEDLDRMTTDELVEWLEGANIRSRGDLSHWKTCDFSLDRSPAMRKAPK